MDESAGRADAADGDGGDAFDDGASGWAAEALDNAPDDVPPNDVLHWPSDLCVHFVSVAAAAAVARDLLQWPETSLGQRMRSAVESWPTWAFGFGQAHFRPDGGKRCPPVDDAES